MKRFTVAVTLVHTFVSEELYEVEVDAETEEEAIELAEMEAEEDCDASTFGSELESTSVSESEVVSFIDMGPPRCQKTIDLFEVQ